MMHKVPESIKFKRLQRRLGLPKYAVIGLLESLWIVTQNDTPQGDIGKYDNEAIAIQLEWEGDHDLLISILIETGWIDEDSKYRLVIHDWPQHAPGWIRRQLARHNKEFITASSLLSVTEDQKEDASSLLPVTDDNFNATPNLKKPKETKPKEKKPCANLSELFARFWNAYPKKKSKGDAEKAFNAVKPNEQLVATMIAKIELAKTSEDWQKEGGQYIPYPATWIRAKGWEDEIDPKPPSGNRPLVKEFPA